MCSKLENELSKFKIKTKDKKKKRVFYTAMYHTMIAPNLYHDLNGEYRGTDKVVYKDSSFTNYTLFSLWDTYRAAHPLYTITHPERVSDFVNSMIKIYEHQGKLPVWHLRGNETNTMPGYSGINVVIDAALKGFDKIDLDKLDLIAIYPVEDETHFTDGQQRVLPDAFLLPRGSTALDLAYKVHTDIGDSFIRAIDCNSKRVIGRDHQLSDGDIIKIVAGS